MGTIVPHATDAQLEAARVACNMMRAHEPHRANPQRKDLVWCSGIYDSLAGHFCQFRGTPQEQYAHMVERVAAALAAID